MKEFDIYPSTLVSVRIVYLLSDESSFRSVRVVEHPTQDSTTCKKNFLDLTELLYSSVPGSLSTDRAPESTYGVFKISLGTFLWSNGGQGPGTVYECLRLETYNTVSHVTISKMSRVGSNRFSR